MKPSIKRKYMAILIGVLASVIIASFLSINFLLEPYYIRQKEHTLVDVYEQMQVLLGDGTASIDDSTAMYLRGVKETYNIDIVFWDTAQNVVYSTGRPEDKKTENTMLDYILGRQKPEEVLEKTDSYQISRTKDPAMGSYYLEMFAIYPGGNFGVMRSPIQSIHQAVGLMNRFLIYTSLVIGAIGLIAAYFLMRNMTAPIEKLSQLAEHMAELDFDAHYEGGTYEEFDSLGNSMNYMADQLEKTIIELKTANLELKKDIEQKQKREEMQRELLSNISHELKTPIALVQGYAEGLKDGITDDPESMDFYCDVIIDEAGKMNQMVKRLLTLNQIESSTEQVELTHFDLTELLQGILDSYQLMIRQKQATVNLYSPENLIVLSDDYMAEEVLRNYIGNALNHLEGQGLIEIRAEKRGEKVHVEVFNTGERIPEESIGRIWDKFYKVDKARTREYGGNGIGLSIVKAVMDTLGEEYGVRNEENGVAFWCEFSL